MARSSIACDEPPRKRRKLQEAALKNASWMKQHEIEQVIDKDFEAEEHLNIVDEVLRDDEEGGIHVPKDANIKITQTIIKNAVAGSSVVKMAEPITIGKPNKRACMGPYSAYVSRNGGHLLVTGGKGHMKLLDLINKKDTQPKGSLIRQKDSYTDLWKDQMCLQQTIRDATFLSSYEMTAIATQSAVQIYSETGHDIHRLKTLNTVVKMNYLPYHFLLATVDIHGTVSYTDMGANGGSVLCRKQNTVKGIAQTMATNPTTGVVAVGQANGVVKMFTPNEDKPVIEMFCQHGGVRGLEFSLDGRRMVTTGDKGDIKVWDARKTFEPVATYKTRGGCARYLAISQNDHIAVGGGNRVMVWDKAMLQGLPGVRGPLLSHSFNRGNDIQSLCFRPFYDLLYCGSSHGVNPMIVPGSGIANVDTTGEFNPYASTKMRRNLLVKQLLEKLPAESIVLDPEMFGQLNGQAPDSDSSSSTDEESESYETSSGDESDDVEATN